jgi:hypothetical protein
MKISQYKLDREGGIPSIFSTTDYRYEIVSRKVRFMRKGITING